MKNVILVSTLFLAGLMTAPVQAAGSAAGNFNVNITLTPKCEIGTTNAATGAVITDLAMAYTSFQTSASAAASTSFSVRCTTGLPFSMALDSASLTDGLTGIPYTLALSASATSPGVAVGSLASLVGVATGTTYYVHGSIASGQIGTTVAGTDNKQRTLTITY